MAESKKEKVRELNEAGLTKRQIASVLNISTQAVYQHLATIKRESDQQEQTA